MPVSRGKRDIFFLMCLVSVALHAAFFIFTRWSTESVKYAVKQAPSSIRIQMIEIEQEAPSEPIEQPVEQKVVEEIEEEIEPVKQPVPKITSPQEEPQPKQQEPVTEPVIAQKTLDAPSEVASAPPPPPKKQIKREPVKQTMTRQTVMTEESRGAFTEAEPVGRVNPDPPYPSAARRRGWEGTVRLRVRVNSGGHPESVEVERSSGYGMLDRSALKTVKKWRFEPARRNGQPAASVIRLPIEFTLVD